MSTKKQYFASVKSKNKFNLSFPYGGGTSAWLYVRQDPSGQQVVLVEIDRGQIPCHDDCSVRARFDDGDAVVFSGTGPNDGSYDVIFVDDDQGFVDRLQEAKRVRIELLMYQSGSKVFDFAVSGLKWPPTPAPSK